MGHAQLPGRGPLKGSHLLAKNKLLRLKHMPQGLQQFLVERLVLALQIEHGHGHGTGWLPGLECAVGIGGVLHANILPADSDAARLHRAIEAIETGDEGAICRRGVEKSRQTSLLLYTLRELRLRGCRSRPRGFVFRR